jgi:hypothetical protein
LFTDTGCKVIILPPTNSTNPNPPIPIDNGEATTLTINPIILPTSAGTHDASLITGNTEQIPTPVSCLTFGLDREEKHPKYFFCNGCRLTEKARTYIKTGIRPKSHYFQCKGGHINPDYPTT